MKSSATISGLKRPTNTEIRGVGRAANLPITQSSIADISHPEDGLQHAGTNATVERSATHATYCDLESSGSSVIDWINSVEELQKESCKKLKINEHGVPENFATWSIIIEQHLRKKYHGYNQRIIQLRRERLLSLAGCANSKMASLQTIQKELYELTGNEIYNQP
jgi:hypothetical protein